MTHALPAVARADLEAVDLSDSQVGLVQGIWAIIDHVRDEPVRDKHARDEHARDDPADERFGLDEMLAISAVAFKNYVYEPDYNRHEDDTDYSPLGEWVCNYGPFEAMSYYLGWEIREFDRLDRDDFWRLLKVEITAGRPVMTLGVGSGPVEPVQVVGYRDEPRNQCVEVVRPGSVAAETIDVTTVRDFQADEPSFHNWLAIARPADSPQWRPGRTRQRLRALRWAHGHANRQKEFSQDTRQRYAPGCRGFGSFIGLLDRLIDPPIDPPIDGEGSARAADGALGRYLLGHVDGLRRARRAAAGRLGPWAAEFLADSQLRLAEPAAVDQGLGAAAKAYGQVADVLSHWLVGFDGAAIAAEDLRALRDAYRDARDAERRASEALGAALDALPKGL